MHKNCGRHQYQYMAVYFYYWPFFVFLGGPSIKILYFKKKNLLRLGFIAHSIINTENAYTPLLLWTSTVAYSCLSAKIYLFLSVWFTYFTQWIITW